MGGSHSGAWVGGQVLVSAALTVTLFAAAGYVPVLGILVGLLAPTPILLVTLRHGRLIGLLALGLVNAVSSPALWKPPERAISS